MLLHERLDRGPRRGVLVDGHHPKVGLSLLLERLEGRQFLDARRAPGGPKVDQRGHPAETLVTDLLVVAVEEFDLRERLAFVTTVHALHRPRLDSFRTLV